VVSQVVLSFGIACALWLLVQLASSRTVIGDLVNRRRTTLLAVLVATAVSSLNVVPWS
jgi:manganese transport protein